MKIALITDGIYPYVIGGMQRHSYYLAKFFARKKIQVDLYHYTTIKLPDTSVFSEEELDYIQIINVSYPEKRKFPGHYLFERYQYSKRVYAELIRRPHPDFIYCKGFSGWYVLNKKRHLCIPIGINFHGYEMFQRAPSFRVFLALQLLRIPVLLNVKRADFVFSYGGRVTEIIESLGIEKKKIIEVPSGIEDSWLNETVKVPSERLKFVFVGRYERRKGVEEINIVLRSLLGTTIGFEFHFIGPISQEHQIKGYDNIIYHGSIIDNEKMKSSLRQMDVLVCPSYSEGMPNVILEGMSCGLAVIATDVGAINKVIDRHNGWLIEGDIVSGLSDCMRNALLVDNTALYAMKQHSVQKIKREFLWNDVVEVLIEKIKKSAARYN